MAQRYLRQGKTKAIYPWTAQLAARADMQECDAKGELVEAPPPPVEQLEGVISVESAQAMATEAAKNVKAEIAELANARFKVEVDPNMPITDMFDLILMAHEDHLEAKPVIERMTKAELVVYAKETFNVDLDPESKVADMRATIKGLQEGAGS